MNMSNNENYIHVGNSIRIAKNEGYIFSSDSKKHKFWESYIFFLGKIFPEIKANFKTDQCLTVEGISTEDFEKIASIPISGVKFDVGKFYDKGIASAYQLHVAGCGPDSWNLEVEFA